MKRAIFLDRDNTIIHNDGDLGDPEQVQLIRGAAHAIGSLRQLGFKIIVVSNQGGVARGAFTESDVDRVHRRIAEMVHESAGAIVDRFYYCPFHPDGTIAEYTREHPWRKPQPGMLLEAAHSMDLDLHESWMVGDQERDVEAGRAAGCQTILITKRASNRSAADFQAGSLAEAAAIIAQNRVRHRLTPPTPIVVTSIDRQNPQSVESLTTVATQLEVSADGIDEPEPAPDFHDAASIDVIEIKEPALLYENQQTERKTFTSVQPDADLDDESDAGAVTIEGDEEATTTVENPPAETDAQETRTVHEIDRRGSSAIALPHRPTEPTPLTAPEVTKTLNELLLEFRSWRQAQQEFTPARMLAVLSVIALIVVSALLAIYLDPPRALAWIGVTLIAEIGMLIMIALSRRS